MSETNEEGRGAVAGQVERPVRPPAPKRDEHGQLAPCAASAAAQAALRYTHAFDGRGIDWQSDEPWPHRIELAQALDWITELGAMVLNLSDRVPCGCREGECESKPTGCRMAEKVKPGSGAQ